MLNEVSKNLDQGNLAEISSPQGRSALTGPDVSFIVAAHNVAPFIEKAIGSALRQLDVAVEVVVIDDASNDDTAIIVERMKETDGRIHLFRNTQNQGPSSARNSAIKHARGQWIAVLDGDDLITPERSRDLLNLASAASADIVADNFERFHTEGVSTNLTMIPKLEAPYALLVDTASFMLNNRVFQKKGFTFGAVKPMFRADFLRKNGICYPDRLDFGEDYLFCLKCLLADARFVVSSETHYKYRVRSSSISWRMSQSHVEDLIQAQHLLGIEERLSGDGTGLKAAEALVANLKGALRFLTIVDQAKQRRLLHALMLTARSPAIWPIVSRCGIDALKKRIAFRQRSPLLKAS